MRPISAKVLGLRIEKTANWRYRMLRNMIDCFKNYQREHGFKTDQEAMMDWARNFSAAGIEDDSIGKIRDVGLATIQNLRMCLGINTVKPDVHVKDALKMLGLGNDVGIVELLSEITGYSCKELDQIFWYYGTRS